jgi:hypothetical protein
MFGWGKSRGEAMPGDAIRTCFICRAAAVTDETGGRDDVGVSFPGGGEIRPGGRGEARSEELSLSYSDVWCAAILLRHCRTGVSLACLLGFLVTLWGNAVFPPLRRFPSSSSDERGLTGSPHPELGLVPWLTSFESSTFIATSLLTITTEGRLRGIIHREPGPDSEVRVVLQLYPSSLFMSVSVSVSGSVSVSEVESKAAS